MFSYGNRRLLGLYIDEAYDRPVYDVSPKRSSATGRHHLALLVSAEAMNACINRCKGGAVQAEGELNLYALVATVLYAYALNVSRG